MEVFDMGDKSPKKREKKKKKAEKNVIVPASSLASAVKPKQVQSIPQGQGYCLLTDIKCKK